ncbi:MAG: Piwi domain-containing protein [Candidatus Heimdallarchaeota archaeon]
MRNFLRNILEPFSKSFFLMFLSKFLGFTIPLGRFFSPRFQFFSGFHNCIRRIFQNLFRTDRYSEKHSRLASRYSRLDPLSRFYEIDEALRPLIDDNIIGFPPTISVEPLAPLNITMGSKFLPIHSDSDFSHYFSIRKLAKHPDWEETHFFFDKRYEYDAKEFSETLQKRLGYFGIKPEWVEHPFATELVLGREAFFRDFTDFIIDSSEKLSTKSLVIWCSPFHNEDSYNTIKRELTVHKDISTQQVRRDNIAAAIQKDLLGSGYINPLIPQLVAKMGGFPYLFQKGITASNTIFVGLDRFRDPEKKLPSVTAAAASFSNHGEYLGAASATLDADQTDNFQDLDKVMKDLLSTITKERTDFSKVVVLRDGTRLDLSGEIRAVFGVLDEFSLQGVFVTANKSSRIRIFEGDPEEEDIAENPDQYLAITDFYDSHRFVVASSQPIITKSGTPLGTAQPVLYTIEERTNPEPLEILKADLARGIAAFTRLNWASFKGNKLPAPITFAHDLAGLCGKLGTSWSSRLRRPTYI